MVWTIIFLVVITLLALLGIANIILSVIKKRKLKKGEGKR